MVRANPTISSSRLAAHGQGGEEGADLRGRGLAVHDDAHGLAGLLLGEALAADHLGEELLHRDLGWTASPEPPVARPLRVAALTSAIPAPSSSRPSRKLRSRSFPTVVRMLSGWNCTPSSGVLAVAQAHHDAVVRPGRDLQRVGHRIALHHQRVVARGRERVGQPREHRAAVVVDLRRLAVHELRRAHARGPRRPGPGPGARDRRRAAGSVRPRARMSSRVMPAWSGVPGPGEITMRSGASASAASARHLVVAHDADLGSQLAQVLVEVVGERVVVVDEQDGLARRARSAHSDLATRSASNMAPALASVSRCSVSGSESATMPAPACTVARPPSRTRVRMAMQKSRLPRRSK